MVVFVRSVQLSHVAAAKRLPGEVVRYATVPVPDDVFSSVNRDRCRSHLRPIQPGIADVRPWWQIPGTSEKVQNVKVASVLVPLCFSNKKPSVLLTLRSSQLLGYKDEVRYVFRVRER